MLCGSAKSRLPFPAAAVLISSDFRFSPLRRKVTLDQAEQRTLDEYLRVARVVSFANTDIELVRGGSEPRRRYLDFLAAAN